MKTFSVIMVFISFLMVLCASYVAHSQCYEGDVIVNTPESYTAADAHVCITGNLIVNGNSNIPDMIFWNLETVGKSIIVIGRRPPANWQLAFIKLTNVIGMINIDSNWKLINIQLGARIYEIGGDFKFRNNDNLTVLRLGKLRYVGNDFEVSNNKSMTSIVGNYLRSVVGLLEITDNASYRQCTAEVWGYGIPADEYLIEDNKECAP